MRTSLNILLLAMLVEVSSHHQQSASVLTLWQNTYVASQARQAAL